ncbi:33756_t:CDS:2, partial [Gigaspora margarita]
NPATYLTGVMTAEIEKDSITSNMNINMMDIEEEDLPTEQEVFKAAMQKHTAILKEEAMQIENTSSWRTYHFHHLKQQITRCEANFLGDYIHNKNFQYTSDGFTFDNIPKYNWSYIEFLSTKFGAREKGKNKYIRNWCGPDAQCWCKNILYRSKSWYMDLEKEAAEFNDRCHDTDDWPIEKTIPAITESETNMWNLPDPYTWETSTNEPELLPATVPVLLPANP